MFYFLVENYSFYLRKGFGKDLQARMYANEFDIIVA